MIDVPDRFSDVNNVSPFNCSSPASVIDVPDRFSDVNDVSPFNCSSPASVIDVPDRPTVSSDVISWRRMRSPSVMSEYLRFNSTAARRCAVVIGSSSSSERLARIA